MDAGTARAGAAAVGRVYRRPQISSEAQTDESEVAALRELRQRLASVETRGDNLESALRGRQREMEAQVLRGVDSLYARLLERVGKVLADRDAARQQQQRSVAVQLESQRAQLEFAHQQQLAAALAAEKQRAERETARLAERLAAAKKQSYYHEQAAAIAQAHCDKARMALKKHQVPFAEPPPPPTLQVVDADALADRLEDVQAELAAARAEIERLTTELHTQQLLVKEECGRRTEQQFDYEQRIAALEFDLANTRDRLRVVQRSRSAESKTVDPDREAKLLAECREKMREEFLEEQRRQADRDRKAAMAANEAHQDQVRRMVMQHQRELTERTRREQELVLKLEQDHAAELERQRIVWQRKLEIAEESSRAVNDPESVRVISERQAKVLQYVSLICPPGADRSLSVTPPRTSTRNTPSPQTGKRPTSSKAAKTPDGAFLPPVTSK